MEKAIETQEEVAPVIEVRTIENEIHEDTTVNNRFNECYELISKLKQNKVNRQDIISQIMAKDFSDKQADYMIQHFDNGVDFSRMVIEDLDSFVYRKFIPTDMFDKWLNLKRNYYEVEELAKDRLNVAVKSIYAVCGLSLIYGLIIYFSSAESVPISGSDVILTSVISLILTYALYKVKQPISIGILAIFMIADRVATQMIIGKFNVLTVFVVLILLAAAIQSFRTYKYIKAENFKILKYITNAGFILYITFTAVGVYLIISDKKSWDNNDARKIENNIYEAIHSRLEKEKGTDSAQIKLTARKTAECTMEQLKKEYGSYTELVNEANSDSKSVIAKVENFKTLCLNKYYK